MSRISPILWGPRAILPAILLLGCAGTPEREVRAPEEARFVGGPEFRRGTALQAEAVERHREAFDTQDPERREELLRAAFDSCKKAQDEYEQALGRYPYPQRESIEFQMEAVHRLRIEILRDRR